MNKKIYLLAAVILISFVGLYVFVIDDNSSNSPNDSSSITENVDYGSGTPPANGEETVQPKQSTNSSRSNPESPPTVSTNLGHVESSPIGLAQNVQSMCSSDANVECTVYFISSDGKEVRFEPKNTDEQGFAFFDWQGKDVGSGVWSAYAQVGDVISDKEVVYIQ